MKWTVIVPVKLGPLGKSRLAAALSAEERAALVTAMARHVLARLAETPQVDGLALLSPVRTDLSADLWIEDQGGGVNAELARARAAFPGKAVAFLNADLPLLEASDVEALLAAAERAGAAIAPDWTGEGTNAIAIADARPFMPAFGPSSLIRHRALLPGAAIVEREGLARDVDDLEALAYVRTKGFSPS